MSDLSNKEKSALRNAAQRLKPAVHVGKKGITPTIVEEMKKALESDELIKIAFKASREELPQLVQEIESETRSVCVGGVGKRRSFYLKRSD